MRGDLFRGESVAAALRAARFILAQTAPVVLRRRLLFLLVFFSSGVANETLNPFRGILKQLANISEQKSRFVCE